MSPSPADDLVAAALGQVRGGLLAQAEESCRAALAAQPGHADAAHVLGIVTWRTGRPAEAARLLSLALKGAPGNAEAWKNFGIVLHEIGQGDSALAALRQALTIQPDLAEAHLHLATMLRERGEAEAAIEAYRRVLALRPTDADALNDLGALLKDRGRLDEAIACLRRATDIKAEAPALINLGGALMDRGDTAAARACYRRARDLAPQRADARFGFCLSHIPISYIAEAEVARSRAAYAAELAALHAYYAAADAREMSAEAVHVGQVLPFYLAYQGGDDRALQEMFGATLARIMAARYPDWATRPATAPPAAGELIRVGFASAFLRRHSVGKLFNGWLRRLDRTRFRVYAYAIGPSAIGQEAAEDARAISDRFFAASDLEALAQQIRQDELHVLIYPEIGMNTETAKLAALRLAPVQCMAWGHPETSGLPTVDYFLTSDLMEPEGGQAFYREKLVRLPNLSIHYAPLCDAAVRPDLAAAGVRQDAVVYLCCQSLYKYLPRNDDIFPRIAAAAPQAQFVFLQHGWAQEVTAQFRRRMEGAFAAAGLDAAHHVVMLPQLDAAHYAGLNAAADIYLDSLEWSGGNTTLEAASRGLPIVTLPGRFMRGRHSTAILRQMGIEATIARNKDDYVQIAARLANEPAWRQEMAAAVRAGEAKLYDDMAPIKALEDFIAARASAGE